ncbi:MAG TPA: molybdopterin-dependent oxidoreductase [Deltaproteobacteria bacterium]|nr:molybdopterin-dependent oxidoreductase [Deltaproteobacteria bacterium]
MGKKIEVSRRRFLQVAGATGAVLAGGAFPFRNLKSAWAFGEHPQEQPPYRITKKVPQVCARACECDCAYNIIVGVDPATGVERAITIEGRPEDPVSNGKFCVKAMGFLDSMYDPDRLMVSLKRTNKKKGIDVDPGWVVMKTEDAVNEIIEKLKTFKREDIVFASPGDPYTNKLCLSLGVARSDQRTECFGTHYYINCLTLTNPPNAYYSSSYTPSHHVCGYDYDTCKYQVWFGFDSFSKCGKAGMLNHWAAGKRNGAKIVMLNPVRTPMTDAFASEFYAIKPGTDLAVSLAMINVIVNEKKYNKDFIDKYSDAAALIDVKAKKALKNADGSFLAWNTKTKKAEPIDTCDAPALEGGPFKVNGVNAKPVMQLLKETVKDYTPEWAAKISEVPAKDIKRIALEFAAAAPKAMIPTYKRDAAGPNYANSWRLRHAINILNSLVGSIDHEGAILLFHDVKLPWLDEITPPVKPYPPLPAKQADFREEFPVTNNIYKNKDFSAPGHYGMIAWGLYKAKRGKAVFFRNPHRGLFAMIQSQMMEAAADRLDLVVDWNLYLDDLGYFCDYVVPAPHQFEEGKLDIRLYYPKWPAFAGGVPVQKSPGDQIGWGGFAMKIGLAMAPEYWTTDGSGDPAKKIPTNIGDVAVKQAGVAEDTADFIAKGGLWVDKKPYENYKHLEKIGYGKPRGRVRMFIDEFAEVGHSPLPIWAPRWHESTGSFKFSLLITRAPWIMHADPNFVNNPVLREMNTRVHMDAVWMNPNAAAKLGLKEGDEILLENDPKYMKDLPRPQRARIHLTNRVVREDCVLLFHGIGHRAKNLKVAANYGYRDGDLIPQKDPEIGKKYDPTGMGWVEDVYVSVKKVS